MKKKLGHKKYYKEKDLIGSGHKPGTKVIMSDKIYVIGKDGECRFLKNRNKK